MQTTQSSSASQQPGQVECRDEEVKNAVLHFLGSQGLEDLPCTEPFWPAFAAYGVCVNEAGCGWGICLVGSRAEFSEGINFQASAITNFEGKGWTYMQRLLGVNGELSPVYTWTSSKYPNSPAVRHECAPEFFDAIERTFAQILGFRADALVSQQSANQLATRMGANGDREFQGNGYEGSVLATSPEPRVSFTIKAVSETKAQAILAILDAPD